MSCQPTILLLTNVPLQQVSPMRLWQLHYADSSSSGPIEFGSATLHQNMLGLSSSNRFRGLSEVWHAQKQLVPLSGPKSAGVSCLLQCNSQVFVLVQAKQSRLEMIDYFCSTADRLLLNLEHGGDVETISHLFELEHAQFSKGLPIYACKQDFLTLLGSSQCIVMKGKSIHISRLQFCMSDCFDIVLTAQQHFCSLDGFQIGRLVIVECTSLL